MPVLRVTEYALQREILNFFLSCDVGTESDRYYFRSTDNNFRRYLFSQNRFSSLFMEF